MIKLDQLSNASSLSLLANRISNRRRTKNVFDANPEDSVISDTEELEKITAHNSLSLIRKSSLLNFHLITPQEQKAIEYGESLLGILQRVQEQILLGVLSYNDLKNLENALNNDALLNLDKQHLSDIISDIQVRVAVELAKYTK
jgi:Class II flagellar assembly regulator